MSRRWCFAVFDSAELITNPGRAYVLRLPPREGFFAFKLVLIDQLARRLLIPLVRSDVEKKLLHLSSVPDKKSGNKNITFTQVIQRLPLEGKVAQSAG